MRAEQCGEWQEKCVFMFVCARVHVAVHVVLRGSLEPAVKTFMEVNSESLQTLSVTECNLMTTERYL